MYADLHLHSNASDGVLSPMGVIKLAKEKGFLAVAITDHDTVNGLAEALDAGERMGVKVIPGIELSALAGDWEIHILGYFIDHRNMALRERLAIIVEARKNRMLRMVEKLQALGLDITLERVREIAGGEFFGRPHLARAIMEKGYINEQAEAFTDRFIGRGGRAYVERFKMSPEEAIRLIKESGGIAVLAHPGYLSKGEPMLEDEIALLVQKGLQGIEVFYSRHSSEQIVYYLEIADKYNLLITGGSDCHGQKDVENHLGKVHLPGEFVEALTNEYKKQNSTNR